MPSYKFESESDSEADEAKRPAPRVSVLSDEDDEPGPDDTFQFRHSFSKAPPQRAAPYRQPPPDHEDLTEEPSFQTDQGGECGDRSFDEMQQDESDYDVYPEQEGDGSSYSEDAFEEAEYSGDPLAVTVRIEKRATWLEQIDFTDLAVKRLNAIDARERLLDTKVHWGGRTPEVKYSTEDLERDLFGETAKTTKKKTFDYLQADALRHGIFDQKSWDEKEEEKLKPNPTFRIRWGPGDVLIHPSVVRTRALNEGSISLTKLALSAIENDAAKMQAQQLLERQIEHTKFSADGSGIPIATPAPSLQFSSFFDTSSLHAGPVRPIHEYESHLWHLASILFDELPPDVPQTTNPQRHRKRQLSSFFTDLVSRSVWNDTSKTRDPAERIFLNLTGYRLGDACAEAMKSKDLHLATLISLADASPESFRRDLARQIEVWAKDDSARDIQVWYRAIYEVLAGQIDGVVTKGHGISALAQLRIGKRVDWRRAFAMRLWFGIPADGEIKDAVSEYWMACQQDPSMPKPLPWYSMQSAPSGIYDGLFQLLRLYSGTGLNRTLDFALNPYNFSSAITDVRIPWHLHLILSQLKGEASFADSFGGKGKVISDTGERLTLSYINQLENLGLWQWSIFVALHLWRENARKGVIMDILARNISSITNETEDKALISKLVDQWKIPAEWILEAKALYARSQGDHFSSAKNLILAKSLSEAQKTILVHIAPQAVISTHLTPLEDLLFLFDSAHVPAGWDIGGQVYLDYLSLVHDPTTERRRRAGGSRRDIIVRLLRALPSMEARTFEQRVAQSEMARVVANLIVSSEFSREVSGVMRLPLLEGDTLRITRKIASGMFEQILSR